jgi:type II secretory pathway component GspD/PulD (secretin)
MNRTLTLLAAGALTLALVPAAFAQSTEAKPAEQKPSESKPAERPSYQPRPDLSQFVFKTYYLSSVSQTNDANEILIALRNMLEPWTKLYLVSFQNAIEIYAPPEQQSLAQKIIADLDRPKKTYRLTYTLAESDAGKRIGVQHFAMVVASGQRTVVKQGSKVPVITGTYQPAGGAQTQFQYLDIGMNFDATLEDSPNGLRLKTKVEQSAVGNPSEYGNGSGPLAQEPIIHQTSLEGSSIITPGKPLTLGSVDVAGSTRHIDIEVVAEPVP